MPVIEIWGVIHAPTALCFDLARDIDLHMASTSGTHEKAIAGVTSGLIGAGEQVTWQATHFGVRQRLISRITIFNPPTHFRDSQVRGAFRCFDHDHFFFTIDAATTRAVERFDYAALSAIRKVGRRNVLETTHAKLLGAAASGRQGGGADALCGGVANVGTVAQPIKKKATFEFSLGYSEILQYTRSPTRESAQVSTEEASAYIPLQSDSPVLETE